MKDFYKEGDVYHIIMSESRAHIVPVGPDDADMEWEETDSVHFGLNKLTLENMSKAYSRYIRLNPDRTYFTNQDLVQHDSTPNKKYVFQWEEEEPVVASFEIIDINLGHNVSREDKDAIINL